MPGDKTMRRLKALENVLGVLRKHASTAGGFIYAPGTTVKLPSGDEVWPDAVYLRKPLPVRDAILGAPDLILQILHNSSPDGERIMKRNLYERNGVTEYWIMDAIGMTFEIFSLKEGRYAPAASYGASSSFASPSFPGLTISVAAIFA